MVCLCLHLLGLRLKCPCVRRWDEVPFLLPVTCRKSLGVGVGDKEQGKGLGWWSGCGLADAEEGDARRGGCGGCSWRNDGLRDVGWRLVGER